MGNIQTKQEKIINKCNNKGYIVYRIQDRLIVRKDDRETDIFFDGKSYDEITKKMIKYLKTVLKE